MKSELGFSTEFAIQPFKWLQIDNESLKWCSKRKGARDNRRTTKIATKKRKCSNINVTQSVESVNTSNSCCPRLIKRQKRVENVKK